MTFDIIIPELDKKPKNTKDAVINLLTFEWPLNLRNIFFKIKKQYAYSSTYQSVYKAVKELVEKKVLIEKNKQYEINVEWIKNVQSFTDIVETNYYAKQKLKNFSGLKETKATKDLIILNFESIFDAEKYLYYFMKTELFKKRNKEVCYQINNEWKPIFYLRAEYNYFKRLIERKHKIYILCHGDSYLEELFKQFYKKIGVNFKLTSQVFTNDLIIFEDCFIQIFIPEKLKVLMKKTLKDKEVMTLFEDVLSKKSSIKVVINKDASLAKEIKKQIINKF